MFKDGYDDSWSSKRIITFLAFVFCSIAFFANLFFDKTVDAAMFEGMIYIAIAGLGVTVTEKFVLRKERNTHQQPYYDNNYYKRVRYGTPIPRVEDREI